MSQFIFHWMQKVVNWTGLLVCLCSILAWSINFIQTLLRPTFLDPIFIRFLEVAFRVKKSNFIQTALRDLTKKAQFLSKHVMRDLGVLSGVLFKPPRCQRSAISWSRYPTISFSYQTFTYACSFSRYLAAYIFPFVTWRRARMILQEWYMQEPFTYEWVFMHYAFICRISSLVGCLSTL